MVMKRVNVMSITKRLVIAITSVLLVFYASRLFSGPGSRPVQPTKHEIYDNYWDHVINNYGIPLLQFCITSLYRLYIKFTVFNVLAFSLKYLPSGIYLYKFVRSVYINSRERLNMNQMELEDLALEIAMVKTKQVVHETECAELLVQKEREAARLREMRTRVLDLIAGDETLRKLAHNFAVERPGTLGHPSGNGDFNLMELLTDDKNETEEKLSEGVDDRRDLVSVSGKSEYSSVSEGEVEKDCQIKIIEVTNVYKVAYLKQYMKQKRIRRASSHALLKKKMATMNKLLESWQKSLNMAMKNHEYMVRRDADTSEDISASRLHESHDSDTDIAIEEINADWDQPYNNYFRDPAEITECSDDFQCQEYNDHYYGNSYEETDTSVYEEQESKCERGLLPRLVEETSSQIIALHNAKLEQDDSNSFL